MKMVIILFLPMCFKPTYKELRHFFQPKLQLLLSTVLSLPIRNCDRFPHLLPNEEKIVLSLPIRNCDLWGSKEIQFPSSCFKPTYKELRPYQLLKPPDQSLSFKPTYKELRHIINFDQSIPSFRFKPTYKELRL